MGIKDIFASIRASIPAHVQIVAAAKTRSKEELEEIIAAGVDVIGENYVQEAENARRLVVDGGKKTPWHMIGSLQKNKINKALALFDCIQTIDSKELAGAIQARASLANKIMPVFIEINIGSEFTKSGVKPEYHVVRELARFILTLSHVKLEGLMTMGPRTGDPEAIRPYFRAAKSFFDSLRNDDPPCTGLRHLSMGMSNSYRVAVEEGATMVRLGTVIFGNRNDKQPESLDRRPLEHDDE